MKNSIKYIENEEGLLIPQIETPNLKNLGKYGTIAKNYLKKDKGLKYYRLIREGTLEKTLRDLNEEMTQKEIEQVETMFQMSEIANSTSFMEIYQEKEALKKSVEEILIQEIISNL